jgi:hypothetical protein
VGFFTNICFFVVTGNEVTSVAQMQQNISEGITFPIGFGSLLGGMFLP